MSLRVCVVLLAERFVLETGFDHLETGNAGNSDKIDTFQTHVIVRSAGIEAIKLVGAVHNLCDHVPVCERALCTDDVGIVLFQHQCTRNERRRFVSDETDSGHLIRGGDARPRRLLLSGGGHKQNDRRKHETDRIERHRFDDLLPTLGGDQLKQAVEHERKHKCGYCKGKQYGPLFISVDFFKDRCQQGGETDER